MTGNTVTEGACVYAAVLVYLYSVVLGCAKHNEKNGTIAVILTSSLAACVM